MCDCGRVRRGRNGLVSRRFELPSGGDGVLWVGYELQVEKNVLRAKRNVLLQGENQLPRHGNSLL